MKSKQFGQEKKKNLCTKEVHGRDHRFMVVSTNQYEEDLVAAESPCGRNSDMHVVATTKPIINQYFSMVATTHHPVAD